MHWKDNIIRQDPKEKLSELKRKVKQLDMSINNHNKTRSKGKVE
jgi:hypothetical protein